MSNIFDALNKQRASAKTKEALLPLETIPREGALLPSPGDVERDLEMERLRQRVLLELGATSGSIVFTGAVEGEGSTTLALLFARELARAEQKPVLLIDADVEGFPRSLSGALEGEVPALGFTDLLEGRIDSASALLATEQPDLYFLPRGNDLGSPLDLFKIDRIQRVFEDLRRHYAYLVIDASPLLQSPEASMIAAASDGVVMVVRANRTRREVVQRGLRILAQGHCRVLGAVLNERKFPIPPFLYRRL
jgi:Mrp family chromosome partitioning ATPase